MVDFLAIVSDMVISWHNRSSFLVGFIHSLVHEYAVLLLLGIRGAFLILECASTFRNSWCF
jgi:hypothetical protein